MKVVMILPPTITFLLGLPTQIFDNIANLFTGRRLSASIFVDTQANLMSVHKERYLVEHPVPGREGGELQDVGAMSDSINLSGSWIYENEPDESIKDVIPLLKLFQGSGNHKIGWNWMRVQLMNTIYRMREPLFLASDLITTAVMIKSMEFTQKGGTPNVYNYKMQLKEINPLLTVVASVGVPVIRQVITIGSENMGY